MIKFIVMRFRVKVCRFVQLWMALTMLNWNNSKKNLSSFCSTSCSQPRLPCNNFYSFSAQTYELKMREQQSEIERLSAERQRLLDLQAQISRQYRLEQGEQAVRHCISYKWAGVQNNLFCFFLGWQPS